MPTRFQRVRRQLDDAFSLKKLRPTIIAEVDSAHMLVRAVIAGMGESIQPWSAFAEMTDRLNFQEITERSLSRTNYLCYKPPYFLSEVAEMARSLVKDEVAKLVREGGRGFRQ